MSTPGRQPADSPAERFQRLDALLRHCVECGLCLPHCATYLATGNEVDSPRGRLILLQAVLEGAGGPGAGAAEYPTSPTEITGALEAFDRCIGCRACETACPSGVPFELLAHAQFLAVDAGCAAEAPGASVLDRRPLLAVLRRLAQLARGLARAMAGHRWRRRLDNARFGIGRLVRLMGSLPAAPQRDQALLDLVDARLSAARGEEMQAEMHAEVRDEVRGDVCGDVRGDARDDVRGDARDDPPPRVVFFRGCASASLLPGTSRRLRELFAAAGCRVTVPAGQQCCGALAAHTGQPGRAANLQRRNCEALKVAVRDCDALVVEAAGCGLELTGYPESIAAKVRDAIVLLAGLKLPALAPLPLRVAIHDPCHARHGLGIVAEPRALLQRIPQVTLVEPEEAEVCCGSGGAYSLRHRSLAAAMGRRKAELLARTSADLVVTSNPGCLGQIADGLALVAPDLPILPLTDLMWYAWRRADRNRHITENI